MKDFINIAGSYLKRNIGRIIAVIFSFGIFLVVLSLYSLPLEAVAYASLLTSIFILIIGIIDFIVFYRKHAELDKLKSSIVISDFTLPGSYDLIEKDYQELIKIIDEDRRNIINQKDKALTDMVDYYTIWAHQIKTPIAAMRLILQSEQSDSNNELLEQLFRIEQYVEMVLQYLRLENINSDFVFKRYSLDDIMKQAVRKYSKTFIRKKSGLTMKI